MRATSLLLSLVLALPWAALGAGSPKPRVKVTTSMGSFTVELEPEAAPKTVENFLSYVREGHYKGTTFHRVIPTFMIQGGGHLPDLSEKKAPRHVQNEAAQALAKGLRNKRGTIAMARTPDPHSASAQFFINVKDNLNLDPPSFDGWGYCTFGKVIQGMEVVDAIKGVKTGRKMGPTGPMQDVPLKPVLITDVQELKEPAPKAGTKAAPKKESAPKPKAAPKKAAAEAP